MDNWERFERERKRKLNGGLRTPGSGNKSLKGDSHSTLFIEEDKSSQQVGPRGYYIDLQVEWFTKIAKYASNYKHGEKQPVVSINIGNEVVYCFLRYDYWKNSCGALDKDITHVDCRGRKQLRICACDDFSYHVLTLDTTGDWICLPEADHMLLDRLECSNIGEESICQKKLLKKPQKTQRQLDWESSQKEKAQKLRKERYKQWQQLLKKRRVSEKNLR